MIKLCASCSNNNSSKKLVCDDCDKVQEIRLGGDVSIFSIFDIKPSTDIDKKMLDRKYAELMSLVHPDRFVNLSEDEKLIAERSAATVNDAYRILSSEVGICEYILSNVNDGKINEIIEDEDNFLSKKIELYGELQSINSTNKCIIFKDKLNKIYGGGLSDLRKNIAEQNWSNANIALQKLKFIINLLESLEKKAYMLEMDEKVHKNEIISSI